MIHCLKSTRVWSLVALGIAAWLMSVHAAALDAPKPGNEAGEEVPLTAKEPPKENSATPEKADKTFSDPTRPTGRLGELMAPKVAPVAAPATPPPVIVAPVPVIVKLPAIVLRGFMKVENKPATAVLEVEGKNLLVVREGQQFNVTAGDGRNVAIKVMQVSSDGIELDVPSLKEHISLR